MSISTTVQLNPVISSSLGSKHSTTVYILVLHNTGDWNNIILNGSCIVFEVVTDYNAFNINVRRKRCNHIKPCPLNITERTFTGTGHYKCSNSIIGDNQNFSAIINITNGSRIDFHTGTGHGRSYVSMEMDMV